MRREVRVVDVFAAAPGGGNPAPIVLDAAGMSDEEMRAVARENGRESGFVVPIPAGSDCGLALRFFVPNHEMEMCGHATIGAVWLLAHLDRLPRRCVTIWTQSGNVEARVDRDDTGETRVEIAQPKGDVTELSPEARTEILSVLRIGADALTAHPLQNACTSRIKTLVPLKSQRQLAELSPDLARIENLCEEIGSTGLYPYAVVEPEPRTFEARQFPKSSGYPEDPATGIAAAALAFGLLANGLVDASERQIAIRQGSTMGRPSEISVRFRLDDGTAVGCWLRGRVALG